MSRITRTQDGDVVVLDLGDDENRFSPGLLDELAALHEQIDAGDGPAALVTTGGGKFFSNGLDLDWLGAHPDELGPYVQRVQDLFERVLTLPVPTVAALNGHAFGAGAMLALAHDFRLMRTERGYLCLPEVDIQIPFTPGMNALVMAKTTPRTAVEAMTTGRRYDADAALAADLVDAVAPVEELRAAAVARAQSLAGKDRATLRTIKARMWPGVVDALRAGRG